MRLGLRVGDDVDVPLGDAVGLLVATWLPDLVCVAVSVAVAEGVCERLGESVDDDVELPFGVAVGVALDAWLPDRV